MTCQRVDPKTHEQQAEPLAHCCQRTGPDGGADHRKGNAISHRIAREIQRIRLQCLTSGDMSGRHLDAEHAGIQRNHDSEPAFIRL